MAKFFRNPAVAGMFYSYDKANLRGELQNLFSDIKPSKNCDGVVSPHAGYAYSGRTAAQAISSLKPSSTFIILGPNHTGMGPELSIMGHGTWKTPLGDCDINEDVAEELKDGGLLEEDIFAHEQEHSVEVQLPFLQYVFGDVFDFVPIVIANVSYSDSFMKTCEALGDAVAEAVKKHDARIIASSDFSHYVPFDLAKKNDAEVIGCIEKLDVSGMFGALIKTRASVCGFGPIAVLMTAMRKLGKKGKLIAYTSSGEATHDYNSVVAYAAIGFK